MAGRIRRSLRGDLAKRRKRRTPEEIRGRLLAAAREEFKHRGYAGATTAAIARRADVAEIQMFRYFPSKGDLFRESVFAQLQDHFRRFNAEHGPKAIDQNSIAERARLYTAELQSFLSEHAQILISLFFTQTYAMPSLDLSKAGLGILQAFFDDCAALMSSRARQGADFDPGIIVRVAFGAVLGCVTYKEWLFPGTASRAAISTAITEFVLAGIGPYSDLGPAHGRRRAAPATSAASSGISVPSAK